MKRLFFLVTSVAAIAASTSAFAVDAVDQIPTAPVAVDAATPFDWSGAYIGAHTGYGWGTGKTRGLGSDSFVGWRLGGFGGYNWQLSNGFVAGVEGHLVAADLEMRGSTIATRDSPGDSRGNDYHGENHEEVKKADPVEAIISGENEAGNCQGETDKPGIGDAGGRKHQDGKQDEWHVKGARERRHRPENIE
jgi:outer membrane immunogenic protein